MVLPESSPEHRRTVAVFELNSTAWGRTWGRRQRGNGGETLAFKWAWSSEGLMEAITRIYTGFNGQKRRGGVGGVVTAGG